MVTIGVAPDASPAALPVNQHPIKTIPQAAITSVSQLLLAVTAMSCPRSLGPVSRYQCVGVRKPVEVCFNADNEAAPELVVKTDLATAHELALVGELL